MAKVSVTLDVANGVDPFSVNTTRSKRAKVRLFVAMLKALYGVGTASRGTTRPTLTVGTLQASCTATLVTAVATNTLSINAKAQTAIQLAARATATLTTPVVGNLIVLDGVTLTAAQTHARGTVTFTGAPTAAQIITVGATSFVATAGAVTLGAATFSIDSTSAARATSLAAQINGHAVASLVVVATAASDTVKIRALVAGTAGNAIIFSENCGNTALTATGGGALAGAFLEGGIAQTDIAWDYGDSDTQGAVALAACINRCTKSSTISATSALGVVKIRARSEGVAGNAYALTRTGSPIALTATGGGSLAEAFLEGGAAYTGDQWDYGDSDTEGAASLAACINRSTTALVTGHVVATSALGVVTIKAAEKGLIGNAVAITKSASPITLAGVTSNLMTGGTATVLTF